MRQFCAVPLLLCALHSTPLQGPFLKWDARLVPDSMSIEVRCQRLMAARIDTLEARHGIILTKEFRPRLSLEWPDSLPVRPPDVRGLYRENESIVYLDPQYVLAAYAHDSMSVDRPPPPLCQLIDHEIAHALTAQEGFRLRGQRDPLLTYTRKAKTFDQELALTMQSEGLAECLAGPDTTGQGWTRDSAWPTKPVPCCLAGYAAKITISQYRYVGGYQLLEPLVRQFGWPTVLAYTIQHPLKSAKSPLDRTLRKWQKKAQRELSKSPPSIIHRGDFLSRYWPRSSSRRHRAIFWVDKGLA